VTYPFGGGPAARAFAPQLITVTAGDSRQVAYAGGGPVVLFNRDPLVTVYLADEGTSPGDATVHILDPLGSVALDGQADVWAITAAGTAIVQATPGATSPTASPAQIAEQIALKGINVNLTGLGTIDPSGDTTGATDTTRINNALSSASPGSAPALSPGIFYTSAPITIPAHVGLYGPKRDMAIPTGNYGLGGLALDGAIIKPAAAFAGSAIILLPSPGNNQSGGQDIRRITIDGSLLPAGTVHGIEAIGAQAGITIRDAVVWKATGKGLYPHSDAFSQPDFWHISKSKFSACGGIGIDLAGLADSWFTDVESTGNTSHNWSVVNGNNTRITNCKGEFSTAGHGLFLQGGFGFTGHVIITNFNGSNNALDGIRLTGTGTGRYDFINPFASANAGTDYFLDPATTNIPRGFPAYSSLTTFAAGYSVGGAVQYRLTAEGKLEISIRNLIHDGLTGNADGTVICTAVNGLPAAYQPLHAKRFPVYCDVLRAPAATSGAALEIEADGSIQCFGNAVGCTRVDGYAELPLNTA
jgi:hypothetical protein